jgi:hypothetical protein
MSVDPAGSGDLAWHVSSTCESGACLMVARKNDQVLLSSTRPDGPIIEVTGAEWREFLAGVKLGEFDRFG